MNHTHTIYEFGSFSELLDQFAFAIILIFVFFIGLAIYLHARYFIDPNSSEIDQRGYQIQAGRKRTGCIIMSILAAIIPFYAFGIGYSYYHRFLAYNNKEFKVVEGPIQNIRDSVVPKITTFVLFSVDSIQFKVDGDKGGQESIWWSTSFNNDSLVRVTYRLGGAYKTDILKFESIGK